MTFSACAGASAFDMPWMGRKAVPSMHDGSTSMLVQVHVEVLPSCMSSWANPQQHVTQNPYTAPMQYLTICTELHAVHVVPCRQHPCKPCPTSMLLERNDQLPICMHDASSTKSAAQCGVPAVHGVLLQVHAASAPCMGACDAACEDENQAPNSHAGRGVC